MSKRIEEASGFRKKIQQMKDKRTLFICRTLIKIDHKIHKHAPRLWTALHSDHSDPLWARILRKNFLSENDL